MKVRPLLAATCATVALATPPFVHAAAPRPEPVKVDPGGLVRWSAPGTTRCAMAKRSWAALQETCYYPVDLLHAPGIVEISRTGPGKATRARISVNAYPYPTQDIDLGSSEEAEPTPADMERVWREQAVLNKVWALKTPRRFELPLGKPASPMPAAKDFGARRVFNGKAASQPHTGADYRLSAGTRLKAVADGTVVVAEEMFFPGNAVFIDHGDGLVSMFFHLTEFSVKAGAEVKKGDVIGTVGSNGRSTGPHLHLGFRWHGARIDPQLLLADPASLPAVP